MGSLINLTGQKFGRLEVLRQQQSGKGGQSRWLCLCSCGKTKTTRRTLLISGKAVSCGCYNREALSSRAKHRHSNGGGRYEPSPTYVSWNCMKTRCTNPNSNRWHLYGGRGITYDPRWEDFGAFLEDMGERPPGTSIDRIDSDGNSFEHEMGHAWVAALVVVGILIIAVAFEFWPFPWGSHSVSFSDMKEFTAVGGAFKPWRH